VNAAIAVLAGSGVLRPLTLARRNRAWEARELFDLIDEVERELAVPEEGDDTSSPPPRRRDRPATSISLSGHLAHEVVGIGAARGNIHRWTPKTPLARRQRERIKPRPTPRRTGGPPQSST
jgi:hypothetical protein